MALKNTYNPLNNITPAAALECLKIGDIRKNLLDILIKNSAIAMQAISEGIVTNKEERLYIFESISTDSLFKFFETTIMLPDEREILFKRSLGNSHNAIQFLRIAKDLTQDEMDKLVKTIIQNNYDCYYLYSNRGIDKLDQKNRQLIRKCLKEQRVAIDYLSLGYDDLKEDNDEAINTLLKSASSSLILIQKFNQLLSLEQHNQAIEKIASAKTILQQLISDKRYMYFQGKVKTHLESKMYPLNLYDKKIIVDVVTKSQKTDLCVMVHENVELPKYLKEKIEPFVLLHKLSK